jgi:hypothetical protein
MHAGAPISWEPAFTAAFNLTGVRRSTFLLAVGAASVMVMRWAA